MKGGIVIELQTISQVSKCFSISPRTLRYYEQIGLITPTKKEDFAYRTYDGETIIRLREIIVLRKLRIPLKQIAEVLQSADVRIAIETFERNLADIEDEITALSTIRSIIKTFIKRINLESAEFALPDDASLLELVDSLTTSKINFKEEKTMEQLYQASERLDKLTDVRIIHLPPMTVATANATGEGCEGKAIDILNCFVLDRDLLRTKPDIRHFGFDCSQGKTGIGENSHKYQVWVTIPDDMDVPEPLVKRTFSGGLYAAHMIMMGNFDHWALLHKWVSESSQYENDWNTVRCSPIEDDMDRCLEEQLNYLGNMQNPDFTNENMQLDLLFPIRLRKRI
jgi:DNA-binding transcriptional MerR regulator